MADKYYHNDLTKISKEELLALAMKQVDGKDLLPHRTAAARKFLENAIFIGNDPWFKDWPKRKRRKNVKKRK